MYSRFYELVSKTLNVLIRILLKILGSRSGKLKCFNKNNLVKIRVIFYQIYTTLTIKGFTCYISNRHSYTINS